MHPMKKLFLSSLMSLSLLAVSAFAGSWTGYISDEGCARKDPAKAESDAHAGCAQGCAKKGATLVLVSGGKIYKLSDQEKAKPHAGHKVTVEGSLDGETINVSDIKM
jgi:hypothetical protein